VLLKEFLPAPLMHRASGGLTLSVMPGAVPRVRCRLHAVLEASRHLALISHPAVAGVIDCVQAHGTVYLVGPYRQGRTLQSHILASRGQVAKGHAGLSESAVLSVGLDLLQVLGAVHDAGILHLDIKPANLLLTSDGELVLLDFDAAQPMADPGPLAFEARAKVAYTPGFSAPESLLVPASQGPWTDIYAVGACLYACMLGQPPPEGLSRVASDAVPKRLAALQGWYSPLLRSAVRAALELDSRRRPQDVAALTQLLSAAAQALDGEAAQSATVI
jgi:serine/threonine protein kinase